MTLNLPFLQLTLAEFSLVPLLVGFATARQVGQVLEKLWGGPETLVVISSDLSHYHPYQMAQRLDEKTAAAITALDPALVQDVVQIARYTVEMVK